MAKTLDQIIQEADELIKGRHEKVAQSKSPSDDLIAKLAQEVLTSDNEAPSELETVTEKIAHAAAIMDTVINFQELKALAEFEKKALAQGNSPEEIGAFLEKRGSVKFRSVLDLID